ncbi:hypothetical protein C2S51_017782 [Perilla frutescens var. frutescens]|nr:hypothetical protein C2S51_017782 [Perilla frutescens var. frutescens]
MALNFSIVSRKSQVIVPPKSTPHEMKRVSDVDNQESLRFYYSIIMFYNNNNNDPINIRQALAKTLVYYYPFSGRLIQGPHHKLLVDCTPEGVLFVEADAAITLAQLGDTILPPCPYPDLLPNLPSSSHGVLHCPLLMLQVTRFECGGFALAIRINHVISDAFGSLQFLTALSQFAKHPSISAPSVLPVWERDVLTARRPPRVEYTHAEYEHHANAVVPSTMNDLKTLVRKSFRFGPGQTKAIRESLAPERRRSSSNFDLITACLWRSRSRALQFRPNDRLRITCAVSLRGKNSSIELPLGYYGNAVIHPARVAVAGDLCSRPLDYAVELVREARNLATEEYSRSAIDYIATMGRPSLHSPWNFIVSDVSRIGFDEVDLGWGKPVYGGTMDGGTFDTTIYGRYRNREGEGVVVAAMALPAAVMERFENELRRLMIWEAVQRSTTQCKLSSNL